MVINVEMFLLSMAKATMSTTQLAEISGVTRTVISRIVNGKIDKVRPQTIGKLANALGVRVEDLI